MMGGDEEELKNKIRKMDEDTTQLKAKLIDTNEFKNKREKIVMGEKEEKYM